YCYRKGISWFEAKLAIIRPAIRTYLTNPLYILPSTA
ncbi:MAG: IS701 family transposase, partial [Candidatus Competibacter denitrificans]